METPYAIEMLHITKRFPGIVANDDITLQLKKGEFHALLGANGAGKSTLLKIIMNEIPADGGQVTLAKGRSIGYLAQHQDITGHRTIYEEVLEGKKYVISLEEKIRKMEEEGLYPA